MAAPDSTDAYERRDSGDLTIYVERELAAETEIEFLMPNVGEFVIRRGAMPPRTRP